MTTQFRQRFRPLNDFVLVRVNPPQKFSENLAIPDSVAVNHPIGTGVVVSVGPGRWKIKSSGVAKRTFVPAPVRVGACVVFFAAAMHKQKGERFFQEMPEDHALIRDSDILFEYEGNMQVSV